MSNMIKHHHDLRIPAMETIMDLTKLIFPEKEKPEDPELPEEPDAVNSEQEPETEPEEQPVHEEHLQRSSWIHSKLKRKKAAAKKRSHFDAYGIAESGDSKSVSAEPEHHTVSAVHHSHRSAEIHSGSETEHIHASEHTVSHLRKESEHTVSTAVHTHHSAEIHTKKIHSQDLIPEISQNLDIFDSSPKPRRFIEKKGEFSAKNLRKKYLEHEDPQTEEKTAARNTPEELPVQVRKGSFDSKNFRKKYLSGTASNTETENSRKAEEKPAEPRQNRSESHRTVSTVSKHAAEIHTRRQGFDSAKFREKFIKNQMNE